MNILVKNDYSAFPWVCKDGMYIRGQFIWRQCFYNAGNFDRFIHESSKVIKEDCFETLINELEGNFSIIFEEEGVVWAAVDIARSFPLFYCAEQGIVSDNAEDLRKALKIPQEDVNIHHLAELLLTGYSMLEDTVYDKIMQIDLGQYVCIKDNKALKKYYFTHIQKIDKYDYADFLRTYPDVENRVFERLITMAQGRQIVVSLSGGFDSRYLVAMLRDKGYENVVCYTFGNPAKYEMQYGEQIAKKLGYKWYGIVYDDIAGRKTAQESEDYLIYSHNHSTTPHISHFLSVKYLKENSLIEQDAMFLTGFCGDLPAGSFVFDKDIEGKLKFNNEFLTEFFIGNEYFNYNCRQSVLDKYSHKNLTRVNEIGKVTEFQSFVQIHDALFTASRPSKMICNANRVFEYFGYEWLMPMWDKEFLEYWYSLNVNLRRGQQAYKKYLLDNIFEKYDIKMIAYSTHSVPWYFRKNMLKTKIKHCLGGVLLRVSYMMNIPIRRKLDWDNNVIIAMSFYKKIAYKKMVNFRRANLNTVMHVWLCEKLYGVDNLRKVRNYLKKDEK